MELDQRIRERRTDQDRRCRDATILAPDRRHHMERRDGFNRRAAVPAVCIYCGKVCDVDRDLKYGANTIVTQSDSPSTICMDCSKNKFPQFYTKS